MTRDPAIFSVFKRRQWTVVLLSATVACTLGVIVTRTLARQQVNTQVYGTSGTSGSIKYAMTPAYGKGSTSELMPSEYRNAVFRSGALPSDVRMQFATLGPMLPTEQYIPKPGPTYKVGSPGPAPYMPRGAPSGFSVGTLQPVAPGASFGSYGATGSVRYSSPMSSAAAMPVQSFSAGPVGPRPMGGAMPAGYRLSGSVRY